ncbi:hypothetical protein ATL39_0316 [Sinobaca qinghaiensis]|uniref:Uncharacterized protein n=1 Tax=Sinobaca qinghaiensis TaxID=342944 RepID=A0A419V7L8_9BACL|nr:hypothetical protein [Sinobaca qinghaiensis]RKD76104.1 hypothetical protein ATL39_0316 [Sinobaca qinghaiensis]
MEYALSEQLVFCSKLDCYVKQELSQVYNKGKIECMVTCTGINESCASCPILAFNDRYSSTPENKLVPST